MRRVENVEALHLERLPDHLRREARPSHPEQDGRVERRSALVGERQHVRQSLAHALGLVEPAEPPILVRPSPEGGVSRPDPLDELGGVH